MDWLGLPESIISFLLAISVVSVFATLLLLALVFLIQGAARWMRFDIDGIAAVLVATPFLSYWLTVQPKSASFSFSWSDCRSVIAGRITPCGLERAVESLVIGLGSALLVIVARHLILTWAAPQSGSGGRAPRP